MQTKHNTNNELGKSTQTKKYVQTKHNTNNELVKSKWQANRAGKFIEVVFKDWLALFEQSSAIDDLGFIAHAPQVSPFPGGESLVP